MFREIDTEDKLPHNKQTEGNLVFYNRKVING